jgi:hypothetical protein
MGLLSYVEISASRPYKELKRSGLGGEQQYEKILKGISLGVIGLGIGLLVWRLS